MTMPFDLNLRHLRALSAIVAEGTVSAAAERIGLSQPALTQGLAKLERQLAVTLFERRPGGLVATAAGAAMAERTVAVFERLSAAARSSGRAGGFARPERLMTATQLDSLLRVADGGGYSGAAASGGVSQPALHRAVRELEEVLGAVLVERRGRGSALTEAGHRMARGARLAERELAAGIAALGPDRSRTGRIVIGAMPLSRARILPRALAAFTTQWPGIRVEIVEGSWRELRDPLRDGVLDLTVGALREQAPPGLAQTALMVDRLAIIGRAGHPLASETDPSHERLADFPWIVGPAGTPLAEQWSRLFAGRRLPAAPVASGSVMVIRGILMNTDLLTLLSPAQVAVEIGSGMLTTIGPALADSVRTIGITTRDDWRPTEAQAALLAFINDIARTTVAEIE